jgi:hypothetical protein
MRCTDCKPCGDPPGHPQASGSYTCLPCTWVQHADEECAATFFEKCALNGDEPNKAICVGCYRHGTCIEWCTHCTNAGCCPKCTVKRDNAPTPSAPTPSASAASAPNPTEGVVGVETIDLMVW